MENANLMINCTVCVLKSSNSNMSLNIHLGDAEEDQIVIAGNCKAILEASIRQHLCNLLGYHPDAETEKSRLDFVKALEKALEPMSITSEMFIESIGLCSQAQNSLDKLLGFTRNKLNPIEYIESAFLVSSQVG